MYCQAETQVTLTVKNVELTFDASAQIEGNRDWISAGKVELTYEGRKPSALFLAKLSESDWAEIVEQVENSVHN